MSKDNAYLADILDSARIIQQHLSGMTREQFLADLRTQDAVVRRLKSSAKPRGISRLTR